MDIERRDVLLWGAALLILAAAVVRLALPARTPIRPVSVEGVALKSEPVGTNETRRAEQHWSPPDDIYLIGWSCRIGAKTPGASVTLIAPGDTALFHTVGGSDEARPQFIPEGMGYRVQKGQRLTVRFEVTNTGPPGETGGATVLLWFVPVEGN
jgi:hypothetical protein